MQAPKPAVAKIMDYLELYAVLDAPPAYYYLPRIQQLFNGCEIPPQWLADTLPHNIPSALFNFTEDRFAFLAVIYLFKLIWPDLAACTERPESVTEEELEAFAGSLDDLETALSLEDAEELQALLEELSITGWATPRRHILRDPLSAYLTLLASYSDEPTMESSFEFRSRLLGALRENWLYSELYDCIDQEITDAIADRDTRNFTAWWKLVNCKLPFIQVYDPDRLRWDWVVQQPLEPVEALPAILADYLMWYDFPRIETALHPADQSIIIRNRLTMELLGTASLFPAASSLTVTIPNGPIQSAHPIALREQTLEQIAHEVFLLLSFA